jgi:hypothetical protein
VDAKYQNTPARVRDLLDGRGRSSPLPAAAPARGATGPHIGQIMMSMATRCGTSAIAAAGVRNPARVVRNARPDRSPPARSMMLLTKPRTMFLPMPLGRGSTHIARFETFEPKSVEIFEGLIGGKTVAEAAAEHGLSTQAIHKIKQRIRARMEELIAAQVRDEDEPDETRVK